MEFFYYVIISIISGIVAGMGMGGGTLLIPALTLIMEVPQNVAQAINLLVFVPCAIIVCIIYTKSKLINYKKSWIICLSAVLISVVASLLAVKIKNEILSLIFGCFLILLGVVQAVVVIVKMCKKSGYKESKPI